MNAREDYPLLAWMEGSAPWPEGEKPTLAESVTGALDHIEALRHVAEAAIAWRRCKYEVRAQTVGETQRRHDAVRFAERHLNECLAELLAAERRKNRRDHCDSCGKHAVVTDVWIEGTPMTLCQPCVLAALTAEGESLGQYWEIEP